jgi:site-specific recombinase XerD
MMEKLHLDDALRLYADAKSGEFIKQSSIDWYVKQINLFVAYLPPERRYLGALRTSDVTSFLASERKRGMAPTTVKCRYRALDIFFNWLENQDELSNPQSPMRRAGKRTVKPPKVPTQEPRRAKLEDVDTLLNSIPLGTWQDLRNRAIIQLMKDTGLRVSEVVALHVADMDMQAKLLVVRDGKGGKDRRVPFSHQTVKEVSVYLMYRPACPGDVGRYLFVSAINAGGEVRHVLTETGIRQLLKRLCRRNKVPHINPHSIRHLFALKALNDGVRVEVLSKIMGHASVDFTLKTYAPLLTQTMSDEYEEHWK